MNHKCAIYLYAKMQNVRPSKDFFEIGMYYFFFQWDTFPLGIRYLLSIFENGNYLYFTFEVRKWKGQGLEREKNLHFKKVANIAAASPIFYQLTFRLYSFYIHYHHTNCHLEFIKNTFIMYFLFVVLQGDLEEAHRDKDSKCVFLTVHDIGSNHSAWESLIGK